MRSYDRPQNRRRLTCSLLAGAVSAAALLAGCAQSPAVGTWKGQVKASKSAGLAALPLAMMGSQDATLTLNADGTGFAKLSVAPEQAVKWSEKDGKVILTSTKADSKAGSDLVGTLSADKQSMSLDLGPISADLKKQEK